MNKSWDREKEKLKVKLWLCQIGNTGNMRRKDFALFFSGLSLDVHDHVFNLLLDTVPIQWLTELLDVSFNNENVYPFSLEQFQYSTNEMHKKLSEYLVLNPVESIVDMEEDDQI